MPEPASHADLSCDVLVVGGGINGVGIARDLAGRGLSIVLAEKDDLASHTSSASTKLIHGGLRYLEHYEFTLVRKSLAEREVLLKSAPHIMWPLRFVMPHDPAMRPVWMIRAGLFLYDHLARRELLPGSGAISLRGHPAGAPLKKRFAKAFVYSDVWVDDARLVVLNAVDAAERGATVLTRTACIDARRTASEWHATLRDAAGRSRAVRARALVNAAGPWAAQFLADHAHLPQHKSLRLVKGSHIIVRRLFEHDHAYIFQNPDQRIIFAIPYETDFTLLGTTEVEHVGPIGAPRIDESEVAYLCEQASRYFEQHVSPGDVVRTFSGVRPLLDDEADNPSAVSRDYALEMDTSLAPLLSVWGGKLTTFRKLAEEAADLVAGPLAAARGAWTDRAVLPGGDLWPSSAGTLPPHGDVVHGFERFVDTLSARHPEMPRGVCQRLARQYGSRVERLLAESPLGKPVAPGLFEAELSYLHTHEWARSAEDVLWRRTKLGLHYGAAHREAVTRWCESHWPDHCIAGESAWR
jgi:glycerol-3-phosphate dehydrogenase